MPDLLPVKPEEDYIDRIMSGDELSFNDFMRIYAPLLYNYAYGIVKTREPAEEIVSDVFFEVWKMRSHLDKIKNIKAWMSVATYRKSISYLRKESGKNSLSFDEVDQFVFEPVHAPDEEMISHEEIKKINAAIEMLPPKCKHVFYLAKVEGLPYKDISEMLNISVKTINNHIAYALEAISRNLNIRSKKKNLD